MVERNTMDAPKKAKIRSKKRGAPGSTVEQRENQLINLAVDLAEKQLSEGTASAQVITHYLKLGSTIERLEKEKLINENKLLKAKTEALESNKEIRVLYSEAMVAFRSYKSKEEGDADPDED
jgi:hypothetical protein